MLRQEMISPRRLLSNPDSVQLKQMLSEIYSLEICIQIEVLILYQNPGSEVVKHPELDPVSIDIDFKNDVIYRWVI